MFYFLYNLLYKITKLIAAFLIVWYKFLLLLNMTTYTKTCKFLLFLKNVVTKKHKI